MQSFKDIVYICIGNMFFIFVEQSNSKGKVCSNPARLCYAAPLVYFWLVVERFKLQLNFLFHVVLHFEI